MEQEEHDREEREKQRKKEQYRRRKEKQWAVDEPDAVMAMLTGLRHHSRTTLVLNILTDLTRHEWEPFELKMVQPGTLVKARKCYTAYGPWTGPHSSIPIIHGLICLDCRAYDYLEEACEGHIIPDPELVHSLQSVYSEANLKIPVKRVKTE